MQHREWNPKAFFKKVSPEVMALFEAARDFSMDRDAERPKADQTYHAWKELPEPQRLALETELLPVNDMCSTHARPYLDPLACSVWGVNNHNLIEESKNWSVHDLAMRLFIDAPRDFLRTHQNYAVDMMEHFREYRGRHPVTLKTSPIAKAQMRQAMIEHFRSEEHTSELQSH